MKIGLGILDILQMIHDSGYVHNSITKSNVIIGDLTNLKQIRLIGFNKAYQFRDKEGTVQKSNEIMRFDVIASENNLDLKVNTRKYDIVQVCRLLVNLVCPHSNLEELNTAEELSEKCPLLSNFFKACFDMESDEPPIYLLLRNMLIQEI